MKTHQQTTIALAVTSILSLAAGLLPASVQAQSGGVYRCGNEYTNNKARIEQGGCTPLTGGRLTIVSGNSPRRSTSVASRSSGGTQRTSNPSSSGGSSAGRGTTIADSTQRARDASARNILQSELDRANQKLAELQKEYNNGAPQKTAIEQKNLKRYQNRVAELKSSIARTESDIAGIRRELGRMGG